MKMNVLTHSIEMQETTECLYSDWYQRRQKERLKEPKKSFESYFLVMFIAINNELNLFYKLFYIHKKEKRCGIGEDLVPRCWLLCCPIDNILCLTEVFSCRSSNLLFWLQCLCYWCYIQEVVSCITEFYILSTSV